MLNKKLSCGCHAARTLAHVIFPTLRAASRDLSVGFSDSQSFTKGQLDSILTVFSYFYLPFSHLTPLMRGSSRAIGFIFGKEKLEWLGYNPVKVA